MAENSHLFGDAKATARSIKRNGSESGLDLARSNFEAKRENPGAILAYAEALNSSNRLGEALEIYREYLNSFPATQEVIFEMALILKALGESEDARDLFTKVVEMAPGTNLARSAEYEMWALGGAAEQRWAKK